MKYTYGTAEQKLTVNGLDVRERDIGFIKLY
jgi:hypothetical protein